MSPGAPGGPRAAGRRDHRPALSAGGFCIPLYIPYVLTGERRFGRGLCKLWLVVDYLVCTASVFNIVLISLDRFISVTRAVRAGLGAAGAPGCPAQQDGLFAQVTRLPTQLHVPQAPEETGVSGHLA